MCAAVTYSPGDVVWAKVPRYPWWPAEVVAQEDCKIVNHGKKNPIAYITFPCEDAYDIIRSESNILPFNTEHKKNYIKKGENLPNDLSQRFLMALKCAQKAAKDNTDVTHKKSSSVKNPNDSIFNSSLNSKSSVAGSSHNQADLLSDSPPATSGASSTITSYTNETSDHLKYTCSQCNFSTCRLNLMLIHYKPEENVLRCPSLPESFVANADSRKRRMVENDAYLRSQHYKAPRRLSTPEVTSRVPCYARKPASPPPQKALPTTAHDRGSCYMFHDEPIRQPAHKPSFSYRSLQKKKDNSSSAGENENSKRSISSFTQPKTYTKLKSSKDQRNGVLSIGNTEKRKEFQMKSSYDTSTPSENKLERPTRRPHSSGEKRSNGEKDEKEEETTTRKKLLYSEKKNSDSNLENKSGSSDESSFGTDDEMCDTITSSKADSPVVENDAVWVKFNKYPFWPALISKVYKKKQHIYRLGIRFFGEILSKESLEFGIRYNKESVIPFNDLRKEEFIKKGEESEYKEKFSLALKKVNEFLRKGDSEITSDNTDQYIYKSSCSSPDPSQYDKTDADNSIASEPSSWYPVDNVNIVEDRQTVEMVSSVLVDTPEDVCQTVLELDASEQSKELSTVSVMPEIWIPSVEETTAVGNEVVLHDIDAEVLVPTATD
ncbi:Hypothetical predicted protein [Octopus vulgaris]|uniref:PWWP domain-containing protein n=2 Tax=Octopus vulgaris TaxID=6645 RepID=A0AA36BH89_OCTVU|nr:Hypothetical predicted protein [Octopus vulgaris]